MDRRGLTTVEYVIVLVLIASVSVATWQAFGDDVHDYLGDAKKKLAKELK